MRRPRQAEPAGRAWQGCADGAGRTANGHGDRTRLRRGVHGIDGSAARTVRPDPVRVSDASGVDAELPYVLRSPTQDALLDAAVGRGGLPVSDSDRTVTLANGVVMPRFGFGVYGLEEGTQVEEAVSAALEAGYRLIDTATLYENEAGVGRAIARSGLPPEDIFVTTKVWNSDQGYERTLRAFQESRERLSRETIDLYLIHWPVPGRSQETWRALERLYQEGEVRAIGVCNFEPRHLDALQARAEVRPMVNQVECHPYLTQDRVIAYGREHGIRVEAWAPLARGRLDHPVLRRLSGRYGKTPAQVVLRWDIERGVVPIPKSAQPERIRANADIWDFALSPDEVEEISALHQGWRIGLDPDTIP